MKKSLLKLAVMLAVLTSIVGGSFAQDGETVTILYWQAVSSMNPYLSGGTKELDASSLVIEPLARYDEVGNLTPWLVDEIPTLENGGISEELTTITWKLTEGLVFSDGSPVTSADAVFTWTYCTTEATGCAQAQNWTDVASVEAVDDLTILITFGVPKPFPYGPLVGSTSPLLSSVQFADCVGEAAQTCTDQNFMPIGTGPYMVEEFRANDVVTYVANPNYRVEGKPFFQHVTLKGGGDAKSAARAVLETGEADYAWNLQVLPQVLASMEAAGIGTIINGTSTAVERIHINQANPDPALGDMRVPVWAADGSNDHPFLTNPTVVKALSMAIDRSIIAAQVYGPAGVPTCNLLAFPPAYASPNNDACLAQDMEGAKALLDEAGIVDSDGDGVRELDGVPLRILYSTSTNAVRQANQALVKQWWDELGVATELKNVDAGVFFGGDVASPDTYGKFYADVEMFTNTFDGTDPEAYMSQWACSEVGPDNNWLGNNISRWCSADYDALVAQMAQTADPAERAALAIQMNDMIVNGTGIISLIHRADVSARANSLEGVIMNTIDAELWNIADWTRGG